MFCGSLKPNDKTQQTQQKVSFNSQALKVASIASGNHLESPVDHRSVCGREHLNLGAEFPVSKCASSSAHITACFWRFTAGAGQQQCGMCPLRQQLLLLQTLSSERGSGWATRTTGTETTSKPARSHGLSRWQTNQWPSLGVASRGLPVPRCVSLIVWLCLPCASDTGPAHTSSVNQKCGPAISTCTHIPPHRYRHPHRYPLLPAAPPCPQGLAQHAMKAAVFDTGEHGVGGRAATRTTTDPSVHADWLSKDSSAALRAAGLTFDHAAQCFTAMDPAFQQQCEAWVAAGAAMRWQGPVGTLKPGGVFTPLDSDVPVYVATGGMRQLAKNMAAEVRGTACGG